MIIDAAGTTHDRSRVAERRPHRERVSSFGVFSGIHGQDAYGQLLKRLGSTDDRAALISTLAALKKEVMRKGFDPGAGGGLGILKDFIWKHATDIKVVEAAAEVLKYTAYREDVADAAMDLQGRNGVPKHPRFNAVLGEVYIDLICQ